MAADDMKTSTNQMRLLQLNDKVAALNRQFIKQLQKWAEQCPHYDFSDTVKSYLEHFDRLVKMYAPKGGSTELAKDLGAKVPQPITSASTPSNQSTGRLIAKAKRRSTLGGGSDSAASPAPKISTPLGMPPLFNCGDVSTINMDKTINTTPASKSKSSAPAESVPAPPSTGPRKRAIRGGGPLGGAESVVFRGTDGNSATDKPVPSFPATNITLPKPTPGFWSNQSKKDTDDSKDADHKEDDTGSAAKKSSVAPMFSFGSKASKSDDATKSDSATSLNFGQKTTSEESNDSSKSSTGTGLFGMNADKSKEKAESTTKCAPSFPGFGAKPDEKKSMFPSFGQKSEDSSKVSPMFPSFGQKTDDSTKSSSLFPSFGQKTDDSKSTGFTFGSSSVSKPADSEGTTTKPALSFPSFGAPAAGAAAPAFSFGALPTSTDQEKKADDEEAEYVPPKADVVENEEPDATYSTKCSVFKMVDKQYSKLGVGMLHLKDVSGKKSVLVRAATTTGTVWINSTINSSMKVSKADEKGEKMTLLCPLSESEMGTFLLRFANPATMKKVMDHVVENRE